MGLAPVITQKSDVLLLFASNQIVNHLRSPTDDHEFPRECQSTTRPRKPFGQHVPAASLHADLLLTVKTLGFETLNEWLLPTAEHIHFMVQRLWERLVIPACFAFLPLGHFAAPICQPIKPLRTWQAFYRTLPCSTHPIPAALGRLSENSIGAPATQELHQLFFPAPVVHKQRGSSARRTSRVAGHTNLRYKRTSSYHFIKERTSFG